MKQKINMINKVLFLLAVSVLFAACNDEVPYVKPFDDINIVMGEIEDIYYYNETLVLSPVISLGNDSTGTEEDSYSYRWSFIDTDNSTIKQVAEGKTLELVLDTIGEINLYFEVEDNDTHIINSSTNVINVESVTNQGWYVLKETAEGNTELDGFYVSSEDGDYNIISRRLGSALSGAPKGFAISPTYNYKPYADSSFYYETTAVMMFSENDALAYDVSNAQTIVTLEDMFFMTPEDANQKVKATMIKDDKVFVSMENGAYTMNGGNPAFFPVIEGDYRVDQFMSIGYFGNTLAFDNKNKSFIMFGEAGYATSDTIGHFEDAYGEFNNGVEVSVNHMNGEPIYMENMERGSEWSTRTYVYCIFKEDNNDDELILYGLDYDVFVQGSYYYYPDPNDYSEYTVVTAGEYSPICFKRELSKSAYPMLANADLYALHKRNNILYYARDNQIGIYNIDDDSFNDAFITDIPSGEQITYMKYINTSYISTDDDFAGLVVATYDEAADIYKIYNYQLTGLSGVSRSETVKTGSGKVKQVVYTSPSSYTWSSELYLYN